MLGSHSPVTVEQAMKAPANMLAQQVILQAALSGAVAMTAVAVVAQVVKEVVAVEARNESLSDRHGVVAKDGVQQQVSGAEADHRDQVDADAAALREQSADFSAHMAEVAAASADAAPKVVSAPIDLTNLSLFVELTAEAFMAIATQATQRLREWFSAHGRNPDDAPVITAEQVEQGRNTVRAALDDQDKTVVASVDSATLHKYEAQVAAGQPVDAEVRQSAETAYVTTMGWGVASVFASFHRALGTLAVSTSDLDSANAMQILRAAMRRSRSAAGHDADEAASAFGTLRAYVHANPKAAEREDAHDSVWGLD